jgi:hypothetical protein
VVTPSVLDDLVVRVRELDNPWVQRFVNANACAAASSIDRETSATTSRRGLDTDRSRVDDPNYVRNSESRSASRTA